jgi:hypothetical protein
MVFSKYKDKVQQFTTLVTKLTVVVYVKKAVTNVSSRHINCLFRF